MTTAVMLMAYGSPRSLDEVGPYLQDIRGGRPVRDEAVAELTDRYRRAGCPSPLLEITKRQAAALAAVLGDEYRVFAGMKHWHPYIKEAAGQIVAEGIDTVIGLALAPHYSKISIGGYEQRLRDAIGAARGHSMGAGAGSAAHVRMIDHWYEQPAFIQLVAKNIRATGWDFRDEATRVFFTAHSLPERILNEGDPYKDQLLASAKLIADAAGIAHWEFAFQSASATGEPWLGPDILQALEHCASRGGRRALVAPIGFVTDHLEILFDVDIECMEKAAELGIEVRRVPSPNDDPLLIEALAAAIREFA
ncbi:MAG: ferrochelatase [Actinomycetota bacterium]